MSILRCFSAVPNAALWGRVRKGVVRMTKLAAERPAECHCRRHSALVLSKFRR
jgi:hypothetical protein